MEGIMSMIKASSESNEIRSVQEIDHPTMQEFLSKLAIWDLKCQGTNLQAKVSWIKNY